MAGTLTISTLSDGTNSTSSTNPIKGSAKAWVAYNGITQTILGSFNVSSVTYISAGNYTVNMTTAMANANYAVALGAYVVTTNGSSYLQTPNPTTTSFTMGTGTPGTSSNNVALITASVFSS
jgi:hypothetical protein